MKSRSNVVTDIKTKVKSRRRKKFGAPKRPMSSYFFYAVEFRSTVKSQHPDWNLSQISAELARLWEACPNKERYMNMVKKDRDRYLKVPIDFCVMPL